MNRAQRHGVHLTCRTCTNYDPQPRQENSKTETSISSREGMTAFERTHVPCRQSVFFRTGGFRHRRYVWGWRHPLPPDTSATNYCKYYNGDYETLNLLWLANQREGRHRE